MSIFCWLYADGYHVVVLWRKTNQSETTSNTVEVRTVQMADESKQDFKLEKENELRFEVEAPHKVRLELVDGHAEIFGVEIVKDKQYQFNSGKIPFETLFAGLEHDIRTPLPKPEA